MLIVPFYIHANCFFLCVFFLEANKYTVVNTVYMHILLSSPSTYFPNYDDDDDNDDDVDMVL